VSCLGPCLQAHQEPKADPNSAPQPATAHAPTAALSASEACMCEHTPRVSCQQAAVWSVRHNCSTHHAISRPITAREQGPVGDRVGREGEQAAIVQHRCPCHCGAAAAARGSAAAAIAACTRAAAWRACVGCGGCCAVHPRESAWESGKCRGVHRGFSCTGGATDCNNRTASLTFTLNDSRSQLSLGGKPAGVESTACNNHQPQAHTWGAATALRQFGVVRREWRVGASLCRRGGRRRRARPEERGAPGGSERKGAAK
jgi:hypothetical protein